MLLSEKRRVTLRKTTHFNDCVSVAPFPRVPTIGQSHSLQVPLAPSPTKTLLPSRPLKSPGPDEWFVGDRRAHIPLSPSIAVMIALSRSTAQHIEASLRSGSEASAWDLGFKQISAAISFTALGIWVLFE